MEVLGYNVSTYIPTVLFKLFKDNNGDMTLAWAPDVNPNTKHINVKDHHFLSYNSNSKILILPIQSANQQTGMLMLSLNKDKFT